MTDMTNESNSASTSIAPFRFNGDGSEYFKIWIVNVLLTIATLGIYSAWATVRNNKYFHSNLYLDDNNFRYLAEPLAILKGRIIALIALGLYFAAATYSPDLVVVFVLALFILMPYFYNQSLAFKMRMSAYKNIQFRFKGSYGGAAMVLFVWPILGMLTFGILMPMAILKMNQYVVNNSAYGTSPFKFNATYKDYGMIFLMMLGFGVIAAIIGGIVSLILPDAFLLAVGPLVAMIFYFAMILFFLVSTTNLFYQKLALVEHEFDCELTIAGYFKVMLINMLLIMLTVGLYAPAAKVRMTKYLSENIVMKVNGNLDDFSAAEEENVSALGEEMGQVFDFA
ncbi:DUF898 domain-containing protein [Psychromonas sp. psych-6C06]|uniref:YjgN family protein n=1 Tax=Psychromonas sp. psych-6C06 TaxID=2058089 RepID=UPI000C325931|nr:YjgN family protein [Psychromonas sp. psych-6C06]PKF62841.1 DUF898 domain-containing protein [Psychromonas sp. psych-6C06]